jgi:hypothetical protein
MRSSSVEQAELAYKEACDSPTSKKYGKWRNNLLSQWEIRVMVFCLGEQKCMAVILTTMKRLKCDCTKTQFSPHARHNVTALVDFTCTVI